MKATIRDVAREAGVSVASVSRALNGLSTVTDAMRDRVAVVADRLGYVPHAGARSLSLSRTNVIGVVLPDLHGEFFSELVRGMDKATGTRGYQMLFSTMHADVAMARQAVLAMHGRVDGLIMMAPQLGGEPLAKMLPRGTEVVLINSAPIAGRDGFSVDNRLGAEAMTRHLIEAGRRAIVHVSGPIDNVDGRERVEGFRAAIARHAPGRPAPVVTGDFRESGGERAVAHLLDAGEPFDAIFAANDAMALGVLQALARAGIAVPEDVAVAGFDDIPIARHLGLTTMHVPLEEIGDRAVDRLVARIAGKPREPVDLDITPELVVRSSTGGTGA